MDQTSLQLGKERIKERGGGGGHYLREAIILYIPVSGGGGGKDFSREVINQGTAIIQGNMVNNFSRSPRSKQLVSD